MSGDERITISVGGDLSGQMAVGHHIRQEHREGPVPEVTPEDVATLAALFEALRAEVAASVPGDDRAAALTRVDELERAVTAEQPKLSTVEYVRDWFADHLPKLAGAVTSVIVSPVVGKVVQAAGDLASEEFRRRFGRQSG